MTPQSAQVIEAEPRKRAFVMTSARPRPLPRVGDNLDRLLDLLDQASAVDRARIGRTDPMTPYRDLLCELGRSA
jgi:hypothetical protein